MRVGVLGTGTVGRYLASGFLSLGHEVRLGSRTAGGDKAKAWVAAAGASGSEGSFADAAGFGDIIVIATLGTVLPAVVAAAGPTNFAGKLVIDVTNPLDFSKGFADLGIKGDDSGGETLQRLLPDAFVVKTLNTVNAQHMFRPRWPGGIPDMYLAGNDDDAKVRVAAILREFGWNPVDLGRITSARWLEAMTMSWVEASMPTRNFNQAFKLIQFEPPAT